MKRTAPTIPAAAFLLGLFLCSLAAPAAYGQTTPLLLVADLKYEGISELEMKLLVDLLSYTIAETGEYLVMNRYERNKLLRGFGYSQRNLDERKVYLEAAELLRARYIVTGSCVRASSGLTLALSLWDVNGGTLIKSTAETGEDFKALVDRVRSVTRALTGYGPSLKRAGVGEGLTASLYVAPIRERILIVLPAGPLIPEAAAARLLVSEAAARFPEDNRFQIYFSSAAYPAESPDPSLFLRTLSARDCHTLGLIVGEGGAYALALFNSSLVETLRFPLTLKGERKENARLLAQNMEKDIPLPDPLLLTRELEREIRIKEKLDELLFNEKFLSQRLAVNIHTSIIKPAITGFYHPLLNILSLESDVYYYYSDFFGIGAGYAFALSYPALIDSRLRGHPLVAQHEIRLIPVSFRSAGRVSVLLNLITALNLHNGYDIISAGGDTYTFENETTFVFLKIALNMGMLISITDEISVFVDFVTASVIIPLHLGTAPYTDTLISGGFGGLGVIVRF
jgi:hypothetical protein